MNAKKRALGKGLSALLEHGDLEPAAIYDAERELLAAGTIGKISLDKIVSNPFQPRADFDEEALQELASSIKEQGVIQPVTVRKGDDGFFQLISGERRCKASRMAGLTEIPAYIVSASENAMLEMAIVENIQRENLNPIEIGLAYKQLIQGYQLTQEMLSERLGKSRSSIANHLRLLTLPGEIQIGLRQDHISMGHARALVSIDNIQTQLDIYNDILAQGLSVREVEEIVKNLSEQKTEEPSAGAKKTNATPHIAKFQSLQKQLSEYYGSKVQIKSKTEGKGAIVINFSSEQDLERIIGLIHS
ncbi:MAG TPA: ParB/RepB/Spo0J family partition protein [Bacteroidales bacterium]|nr:ParB/RepB/Spo0J family partition protein [Bacteroidales bacterium]